MKKVYPEKIIRVAKNRKKLEKELGVSIKIEGGEVIIDGEFMSEYICEKIVGALGMGFPYSVSLLLKEDGFDFVKMNIKDYSSKKKFSRIRARIIGKKGKTLKTISLLTGCHYELLGNTVGIIGRSEDIENAEKAIIFLVRGAKQSNVYNFLEKHKYIEPRDLGLKEG